MPAKDAGQSQQSLSERITGWYQAMVRPGSGRIVRIGPPTFDPTTGEVIVAGETYEFLEEGPTSQLCALDRAEGQIVALTRGDANGVEPRFAPAGGQLAFRRERAGGGYEARLLNPATGEGRGLGAFDGSVEALGWLPDSSKVILLVADPGVSLASTQGAFSTDRPPSDRPSWWPRVDDGESPPRRRLWLAAMDGALEPLPDGPNPWEICAAGSNAVAMVATNNPAEDAWYQADVRLLRLDDQEVRTLYRPRRQLAALSSNDSGSLLAVVEGLASDRGYLTGDLVLISTQGQAAVRIDTDGVDVSWTGWRGEALFAAGVKGARWTVLEIDTIQNRASILYEDDDVHGRPYPQLTLLPGPEFSALAIVHEVAQAERLVVVRTGGVETLASLASPDSQSAAAIYDPRRFGSVSWIASDGVQIDGFLHLPPGQGPFPLVMMIHGGPTMRWTPRSLLESPLQAALADRGFAQFMPNPRGSTGRGQAFADSILHDVGGRDALDLLEGVDSLIERGLADPGALYVTGVSYGGFMTSWLVTMDSRFKAAAAVSPITDWASQRLTSDLPTFNDLYIGRPEAGDPSPIRFADRVQTEMLMIAGAKDHCTPPAQAEEFHRAVRLAGGASTLVVYPQEGHGISANPAAMIDHIARVIGVFEKHPPRHRRFPGPG